MQLIFQLAIFVSRCGMPWWQINTSTKERYIRIAEIFSRTQMQPSSLCFAASFDLRARPC